MGGSIFLSLLLSGCAVGPVQTWEGEKLAPEQSAVLKVPEDISIVSVNGKSMSSYLVNNMALDYLLKPGVTNVQFRYESVWASGTKEEGRNKPFIARSELREVTFDVAAGKTYAFAFEHPADRISATSVAQGFQASIVADGVVLANSMQPTAKMAAPAGAVQNSASVAAPVIASNATAINSAAINSTATAAPASSVGKMDAIKLLWGDLSAQEKKEFLRWAFK